MAVYLHGVTPPDVLDTIPADTRNVSESTTGLNLGQVRTFIERAAGQVNNQLVRHGMTPESLGENPSQLARDAIISYAAAYSYERLGGGQDAVDRRLREWERLLKQLREEPQSLGEAQDGDAQSGTRSNIDLACPTRKRWSSGGYNY